MKILFLVLLYVNFKSIVKDKIFLCNNRKDIIKKRINKNINSVYFPLLDLYKFQKKLRGPNAKLILDYNVWPHYHQPCPIISQVNFPLFVSIGKIKNNMHKLNLILLQSCSSCWWFLNIFTCLYV